MGRSPLGASSTEAPRRGPAYACPYQPVSTGTEPDKPAGCVGERSTNVPAESVHVVAVSSTSCGSGTGNPCAASSLARDPVQYVVLLAVVPWGGGCAGDVITLGAGELVVAEGTVVVGGGGSVEVIGGAERCIEASGGAQAVVRPATASAQRPKAPCVCVSTTASSCPNRPRLLAAAFPTWPGTLQPVPTSVPNRGVGKPSPTRPDVPRTPEAGDAHPTACDNDLGAYAPGRSGSLSFFGFFELSMLLKDVLMRGTLCRHVGVVVAAQDVRSAF